MNTWVFLRLTGALLALFVALHLIESFYLHTTFDAPVYKLVVNVGLVVLPAAHGLAGLKQVIDDHGVPRSATLSVVALLSGLGVALMVGALAAFAAHGRL
jgi:succinate dehydrogenase hydrophobic anchor subunit